LAARLRNLIASGDAAVLLAGAGPDGVAVARFRPTLWEDGLECYLAELYVTPERRRRGLGRILMDALVQDCRRRGVVRIELGTSEDDVAARALYERSGFTNRERPDGPIMYVYERML
jgi:ribosomal protein S18 acetylase RimI-like enzyme